MMWIIVVLIVVVVVVGGIWGLQRVNVAKLHQLDQEVEKVDTGELRGLIRTIANLGLAGESLRAFTKSQRDYQHVVENELAGLQTALLDVELENKQFQFVKVRQSQNEIKAAIIDADAKLTKIKKALVAIQSAEVAVRDQLKTLRTDYQAARKTILAKSYAFDSALPALEAELQTIATSLHEVATVSESGDHAAASEQMDGLTVSVSTLQDEVARLPKLVNTVVNEFPGQLDELDSGFHELAAQHFVFTQDVPAGIEEAQAAVKLAHDQITDLKVDDLADNVAKTAENIDGLYATMEKELNAKTAVQKQTGDLRQFIAHAQKQNHTLLLELDHLNQSYTLTHNEQQTAESLRDQLDAIAESFTDAQHQIQDNTAIYSEILSFYNQTRNDLHAVETQHQAINAGVSDLQAREHQAVASAEDFANAVRDIKYEVSRHQLPGLPRPYLDFFNVVTKELKQLENDLNQVKINLDDIAKSLIKIGEDIDQLKDQSRTVVDSAGMCEQLLQYANRYKTTHAEVETAATQAKDLYQHYNYSQAADVIAAALEKVEPGAYQKVEDDYLKSQSAALF
jgi:septation ring formation regulator